jgi:acetylornithine/N-succinyldiaminopimelate aminotransferase
VSLAELRELEQRWTMPTYGRSEVEFVRGEGAQLWDADGKRYLDFVAGISVSSLGHCHPAVVAAIRDQAERLIHVSNLFYTEPALRLAERLCDSSLGGKAFLCNSGAEANECAIKLARAHAHDRGIAEPEIVVLEGAFHGRTMGALSATPELANDRFSPYLPGFRSLPRDDADGVATAVTERTAAVLIEPVQGECGVFPIADEVLAAAREATQIAGGLLIFDEIQAGLGRTGSLWAYEQTPVRPDVLTTAKALGGGLPIGACLAGPEHGDVLGRRDHGSTFAGGPLACAAALAAFDAIADPGLLRRVRELGARFRSGLEGIEGVAEVRGRGLMIACDLAHDVDASAVARGLLEAGLVVNVPAPGMLRFLPPLVIEAAEVDEALSILSAKLA